MTCHVPGPRCRVRSLVGLSNDFIVKKPCANMAHGFLMSIDTKGHLFRFT